MERPFGMAGLYDNWIEPSTGDLIHSFTVITVSVNSFVRKIKVTRMPVILTRGKEAHWLKPTNTLSDILSILKKYPSDKINGYPISKDVNQTGLYAIDILKPVGERLLSEVEPLVLPSQNH
jgi:putative SOS response-associated peptidase YedK